MVRFCQTLVSREWSAQCCWLPERSQSVLLLRAKNLFLSATHLHSIGTERAGCAGDRCDHSIKVKKQFHRLLPKQAHPDCRLSVWFDFHSMPRLRRETRIGSKSPAPARVSRRGTTMLLANNRQFAGRACEVPNDPLDHPGNLPTHRPLADRVSRANLEIVEPLARVDMWTGNAAAPR